MLETVGVVREREREREGELKTDVFSLKVKNLKKTYKFYKIENKKYIKKEGLFGKSRV